MDMLSFNSLSKSSRRIEVLDYMESANVGRNVAHGEKKHMKTMFDGWSQELDLRPKAGTAAKSFKSSFGRSL